MIFGKYIAALCIPRIHEATNHNFIASLSKCLSEFNCRTMVYTTPSELYWNSVDEQGEKTVFELINYNITDVVIIQDEVLKDKDVIRKIIERSHAHNIPVITVGGSYENCSNIRFDYSAGFEKIVRHVLVDHGIRNFHLMAGIKGNEFSDERIEVVRKVADELDIPFSDEDISYGEYWSVPTERAMEALFTKRRRLPQAIICVNDTMAITVINTLKSRGYKIPQDIMVTGFDGISDVNYCDPRITTCLCSSEQLAESVANTANDLINGKEIQEYKLVIPTLQKSESCGCKSDSVINASVELAYVNNSFNRYQSEEEHMFRMMSRVLECHSFPEVAQIFNRYDFYDMIIVLNPTCLDPTINPLSKAGTDFSSTMKIIYNSDNPMNGRVDDIDFRDLHPQLKDVLTDHNDPLIIFSLNYVGLTMGYVCFTYHNYDIQNYYKASQIINTLNSSFGAFRTVQYQHYLTEKIEEMYRCDGLTHLLNRTALKNSYPELIKKCNGRLTVVLADLDGLKSINDNHGHDNGDFSICTVANALKSCCPAESLCIRWGGDEMVAVIPGDYTCQKIRSDMDKYIDGVNKVSGKPYIISASVGVKTFDVDNSTSFEEMVRATDQLMYSEKNRKKAAAREN